MTAVQFVRLRYALRAACHVGLLEDTLDAAGASVKTADFGVGPWRLVVRDHRWSIGQRLPTAWPDVVATLSREIETYASRQLKRGIDGAKALDTVAWRDLQESMEHLGEVTS